MDRLTQLWPATDPEFPPAIVLNMPADTHRLAHFVAHNADKLPGGCWRLEGLPPDLAEKDHQSHIKNGSVGNVQGYREALVLGIELFRGPFWVFEDDCVLLMVPPVHEFGIDLHNVGVVYGLPHPVHVAQYGPVGLACNLWTKYGATTAIKAWQPPISEPSDVALVRLIHSGQLRAHVVTRNTVGMQHPNRWAEDANFPTTIS